MPGSGRVALRSLNLPQATSLSRSERFSGAHSNGGSSVSVTSAPVPVPEMPSMQLATSSNPLRLGFVAIGINVSLMLVKIGVGVIGHSYALIADGIESASDIFSSIVTWAGFRLSLKPADEDHPYGHGKIDALTGMFSGLCLLAAAVFIAYQAIDQISTPHHLPAWFTLPVLLTAVVVKEFLSRRVFAAGNDLDSSALKEMRGITDPMLSPPPRPRSASRSRCAHAKDQTPFAVTITTQLRSNGLQGVCRKYKKNPFPFDPPAPCRRIRQRN